MLVLLGAIYLVLLVVFGTLTWRKRRFVLFWVGIIIPVLWMIGAVLPPKPAHPPRPVSD
jgi:hypothetical protein